ncbi:hypothetical protein D3C72_2111190 [compost metagenome]
MVYIAKSVKPSTWTYVDYILENGFKEAGKNYTLHFTKTGTTDSWAFQDNEWMSQVYENSLYFPKGDQKGLVRTYFVTPGSNQLEAMRLFKRPK